MSEATSFAEVLEAIDRLSPEDQKALIEIVRRRVAEQGRKRIIADVQEANREYEQGQCGVTTVDDLMGEIHS